VVVFLSKTLIFVLEGVIFILKGWVGIAGLDRIELLKDFRRQCFMGVAESPYLVGERLGLTIDETAGIVYYISPDGYKINDKLRNDLPLNADDWEVIKNLDGALEKLPKYEGVVYRSLYVIDADAIIKEYAIAERRQFKEYLSSSVEIYDERFQIQYIINSKNGKDIRSFNEMESEILFRRNTWFWIDNVDGYTIYMTEM